MLLFSKRFERYGTWEKWGTEICLNCLSTFLDTTGIWLAGFISDLSIIDILEIFQAINYTDNNT